MDFSNGRIVFRGAPGISEDLSQVVPLTASGVATEVREVKKAIVADIAEQDSICPIPALDWRSSAGNSPAGSGTLSPVLHSTASSPGRGADNASVLRTPSGLSNVSSASAPPTMVQGGESHRVQTHPYRGGSGDLRVQALEHARAAAAHSGDATSPSVVPEEITGWEHSNVDCANWMEVLDLCRSSERTALRVEMVDIQLVDTSDVRAAIKGGNAQRLTGDESVLLSLKFKGMERWHHPAPEGLLRLFAGQL